MGTLWQECSRPPAADTLPRRILSQGGSWVDISVRTLEGWLPNVTLVHTMDTGHPLNDKAFMNNRVYAGFFVFSPER